jgi:DNA (cytosine-5)-methyltransferase 1
MINNSSDGFRIRKLTPKECFRLMGFSDEAFERARKALNDKFYKGNDRSSSQLYKQAGNSIVTDVLFYIFYELYQAMPYLFDDLKVSSYFSGIGAFEIALDRLFDVVQNGNSAVIPAKSGGERNNNL